MLCARPKKKTLNFERHLLITEAVIPAAAGVCVEVEAWIKQAWHWPNSRTRAQTDKMEPCNVPQPASTEAREALTVLPAS